MLACQFAPQGFTHVIDVPGVELAGGIGEIDILEDTQGFARNTRQYFGTYSLFIDGNKLARRDFAHEVRADAIESARFGGDDPAFVDTPDAQWTHSPGVAHGVEFAIRQHHHTVRAA